MHGYLPILDIKKVREGERKRKCMFSLMHVIN